MTGYRSSSDPTSGAAPGDGEAEVSSGEVAASGAGDPLAGVLRSSSSWSSSADVELQRDLLARRMFDGQPVTIDRFEVERLVGAGASAAVYAARDPLLGRRVALKVLARARPGRVGAVTERLIREARALADLSHRNVVTIYEVGQWNDRPFIAMELIEGTTLARWLAAERRSVAAIRAAFVEAGRGLAAAHAGGHVHRDFKPANVLVAHDGRVVVSDFGVVDDTARDGGPAGEASGAGDAGGSTPRRPFVGTPAYVSPEQRAGAAAHPSADVYSFALALVEALLGYHPMPESTTAWRVALRGRVPRRLYHEICAALTLQPQQRTPSLGPLLDALAVRRDVRPRRLVAALAIGSIIAFTIGALWSRRPPGPPLSPDPLLVPAEIFQGQQALLGTPAEARDDTWAERARTWLMLPIPARVPCRWPVAPSVMELVGDHVVALDSRGQVTSCAIGTGIVSLVASDVTCLKPVDEATFGIALQDNRIEVYQHGVSGWRPVPVDGPTADEGTAYEGAARCQFDVSSHGLVRPRLFMPKAPPPPKDDRWLFASGDRTVAIKVDGSIYAQSGDTPPALVDQIPPRYASLYGFDERLHYLVLATPTHVRIHDLSSRSVVAEAPVPWTRVNGGSVAISRNGSTAVAVGLEGPLLWWRRGERWWHSQLIAMNAAVVNGKISPLGERVLIWDSTGRMDVVELVSGRRYPLAGAQINKAMFLDDDQVVAIDEAGAVWRWSLRQLRSSVLADHAGGARMWGFATCDGGRSVLTATDREDRDILISAPSGAPQATLSVAPGTRIFGLACQGERLLAGTRDGHLLAWDWRTGHPLFAQDLGVRAWVWTLATAQPVGGPLVTLIGMGQIRDPGSGGRVLALRDGALTPVFHAQYDGNTGINDIAVAADGRRAAAVASSGELALIDVAALTPSSVVQAHTADARRVRFSERDQAVVTAGDDGYLRTWRVADGSLKLQDEVQIGFGKILDLDVRGTRALVATMGGHVGVWDLKTQRLLHAYAGHSSWVITARFDTSGQWIASGDQYGRVCLHHVDRDACYAWLVGHQRAPIAHVKFLDDGQLLTVSEDGTARQWNLPYRESNAELACELEERLFDHGAGTTTRDCGPSMLLRLLRAP